MVNDFTPSHLHPALLLLWITRTNWIKWWSNRIHSQINSLFNWPVPCLYNTDWLIWWIGQSARESLKRPLNKMNAQTFLQDITSFNWRIKWETGSFENCAKFNALRTNYTGGENFPNLFNLNIWMITHSKYIDKMPSISITKSWQHMVILNI